MSNTPVQEPPVQESPAQILSTDSEQTLPSRPFQPISDPSASKRVCFYKSGDYTFSGHRMVINARTFKTFDALLDALSKKVPLPFGVRTITTPRGTNLVKALEDLNDGGSYICSDQRRVKPINLDEVNRRQVPWNTTRPFSAGRRKFQRLQSGQFRRINEVANRPMRITERAAVRTPKRLEVIKNRDPTVKRTIVLQRRTAPTFDALLDYLSQILQFPVLKLFSADGQRVDGLAALILCSGVVVAAGNEPFRLGNYSSHKVSQMAQETYMDTVEPSMLQPRALNNKSFSSGRGSRNFSLSSERYIVSQINKSRSGSTNSHLQPRNRSFETETNHQRTSFETCETGRVNNEQHTSIVPQDDDIEKSFRVNQDGSMTVEMKVRLTVKEEEMLHWTTTLSRTSLSKRTVCASISESGKSSTDSDNAVAKNSSSISGDELKEGNHPAAEGKGVKFNEERMMGKAKTAFKRSPTPSAQQVKRASVESVKMVTDSGVQESTLGHYSYMERTAGGEKTEGYRVVRHSSSSNRPIPKPRKTPSAGAINKGSHSSIRSSGVAEVLQIQNNGMEVTETVMHIYESQGSYDNYYANEEYSADGAPSYSSTPALESKPSLDSAPPSSSNDCDIDFSSQQPTRDSLQRQKEEMLSLSSEPITQTQEITNHQSSVTKHEAQRKAKVKTPKTERKKMIVKPVKNPKSLTSSSSSDKKLKESRGSPSKNIVQSSPDKLSSNTSMEKKSSSESVQNVQRSNGTEKPQFKRTSKDGQIARKEQVLIANAVSVKRNSTLRQNMDKTAAKNNGHNVNSPTARPQMKKNMSDILQTKNSLLPARKSIPRPKSVTEHKLSQPKKSQELSESLSTPSFKPSLSEIHQYVENWLEKVSPDPVPYTEETNTGDSRTQTKVVFQIGADSESDEKTEDQTTKDDCCPVPGDVNKSASCLTVPQYHADPALLHNEHYARGLCVSMPSVRVDSTQMENVMRSHKSAEAIGPADNEASSSSNFLSPHAKLKPVLNQIYSSIQCIRGVSETNATSNLEKSTSLPDFPTQVASVFGSSCKAFLSFLSVMTLRDNLKASEEELGDPEAMLMMQSLQKISAIEDTEELRASLTDLQSRASSQLRARWKDFQILRERLESEPLSPRVSETEFALDVVSEGGDVFDEQHLGIDELMEEMNMPQELRAEICSTIQQSRFFYPVEESTFIETERNQSDSEEDVEKFVEERNDESEQSPEHDSTTMVTAPENELAKVPKTDTNVKQSDISQTERDDLVNDNEREKEEQEDEGDNREELNDGGDEVTNEIDEYEEDAESEAGEMESDEEVRHDDKGQEGGDAGVGSEEEEESVVKVEEGKEEEMIEDEEEEEGDGALLGLETEGVEVTEDGLMNEEDQESGEGISAEETDEREGDEETEKEEDVDTEVDRGTEEEENEEDEAEEEDTEEEGNEETEVEKDVKVEVRGVDEGDEEMEEEENVEEEVDKETKEEDKEVDDDEETEEEESVEEEVDEEPEGEDKIEDEGDEETEKEDNVDIEVDRETEEEENEEDEVEEVHNETEGEENVKEEGDKDTEEEESVEEKGDKETEGEESVEEKGDKETEGEESVEEEGDKETEEEDKEVDDDKETEGEESVEDEVDDETEGEEEEEVKHIEEVKEDHEGSDDFNEVSEEGMRKKDKEEGMKNIIKKKDLEDEVDNITEDDVIEEREEEEEEEGETLGNFEEEEKYSEGGKSWKNLEKTENTLEEESVVETEVLEGVEIDEEKQESDVKEEDVSDEESKNLLEEALYLQQQSSCEDDTKVGEHNPESVSNYSSEIQCADDKGDGTDTVDELETDEGGEHQEELNHSQPHPVEISQELLDFVNSALQCASLVFTYDVNGKIRIEPDNSRVVKTNQTSNSKNRNDSSYGVKCLPSPECSDLSDYRPETSESGGYQTQESVDIASESGEEGSQRQFPVCRRNTDIRNSKLSVASDSKVLQNSHNKSGGSFSSLDSAAKASKEDLSYFSAGSSQKEETEASREATQCSSFPSEKDSKDGVLIDQGRWLLKENHLIRTSPPVSMGMYNNVDSSSTDTSHSRSSVDSLPHYKTQQNLLAALSSSELEEMAKPKTPKCTYYNMPHGSDSDPFLDESSLKSGKKDTSSVKGRGVRVAPTINTSQTWANKNGSLSSFASVEFNIPDRKVHPEGEASPLTMARRTSGGGGRAVQAQDSIDTLHLRCGQYCPIL